jgi:hypothetical protein
MASVESWIYSRLTGFAGLSALVGTRLYPSVLPENPTYPAISYRRIDAPNVAQTHEATPAGLARPRFQFDCWGTTATSAKAVGEQVRLALEGYQNKAANPRIDGIILADRRDGPRETGSNLYRDILDFFIWHSEPRS